MRPMILGLALLGAAAALPALAQGTSGTSTTNPGGATATPPALTTPDSRSGATTTAPGAERTPPAATIDSGTRTADAPAPGANSFTEGQARSRIEAAGFTGVTELQKDDQGVWRGRATRAGQQTSVSLDYQGNVTTR